MSADSRPTSNQILDAIRGLAGALGRSPTRDEFRSKSGFSEYQILAHFPSWGEAARAAGMTDRPTNQPIEAVDLLRDWGEVVRRLRRIPTRMQYVKNGSHSSRTFQSKLGPWSSIPLKFRERFLESTEWTDVIALLPAPQRLARNVPIEEGPILQEYAAAAPASPPPTSTVALKTMKKVVGRQVFGKPIDFRGLRHEPINEQGVVFLFGMLAHELGFYVEAVQTGFPDCEAKRQVGPSQWQRVRIEFEYMSRNYVSHLNEPLQADIIVCWKHNWPECPAEIEVLALARLIEELPSSSDMEE